MSIERAFVAGAGLMGHGIAQVLAASGRVVDLYEPDIARAEAGRARIIGNLERSVAKGRIDATAAREIADALTLSLKSVESHLRRLFNRYAVMNRTELAVLALREGWVDPGLPAPD